MENEGKPSLYSGLRATQLTHSRGHAIEDFAAPGQTLLLPPRVFCLGGAGAAEAALTQ